MDFLKIAYGNGWSEEVANYLITALRPSTLRQYQSICYKFQRFLHQNPVLPIDLNTVCKFLIYIFEQKGYQVNTLLVYKCALVDPLTIAFKLDMNDKAFSSLFRSMWLRRPGIQFKIPEWNLDLVLELLCSNEFNINVTNLNIIRKCVFLLGLALLYL